MNTFYKDFIGIYESALTFNDCLYIINKFENELINNVSLIENSKSQFANQELGRMDYSEFVQGVMPDVAKMVNGCLSNCVNLYSEQFFPIKKIRASSLYVKLQKTPPRGGYHVWHSEADCREHMDRVLAWTIYLNDIPEGEGETEFLWQGIKVKPKAGTCVIWPAFFTHPHRGNPVYSCDKYIATGWYTHN